MFQNLQPLSVPKRNFSLIAHPALSVPYVPTTADHLPFPGNNTQNSHQIELPLSRGIPQQFLPQGWCYSYILLFHILYFYIAILYFAHWIMCSPRAFLTQCSSEICTYYIFSKRFLSGWINTYINEWINLPCPLLWKGDYNECHSVNVRSSRDILNKSALQFGNNYSKWMIPEGVIYSVPPSLCSLAARGVWRHSYGGLRGKEVMGKLGVPSHWCSGLVLVFQTLIIVIPWGHHLFLDLTTHWGLLHVQGCLENRLESGRRDTVRHRLHPWLCLGRDEAYRTWCRCHSPQGSLLFPHKSHRRAFHPQPSYLLALSFKAPLAYINGYWKRRDYMSKWRRQDK